MSQCTLCGADLHHGRCREIVGGVIQPNVVRLRRHFSVAGVGHNRWSPQGVAYTLQNAPDNMEPRPDNG